MSILVFNFKQISEVDPYEKVLSLLYLHMGGPRKDLATTKAN